MSIPTEAVEAAARVIYGDSTENVTREFRDFTMDKVRAALEAAAPHMPSDLEVFVRMFEEFAVNLGANNTTDDPHNEGQAEAFTFAARQLRAALTKPV